MIICRSSPSISMLHLYKLSTISSYTHNNKNKLFSHLRPSFSYLFSNSTPSLLHFTSTNNLSTAATALKNNSNTNSNSNSDIDTFFADDAVSWASLGLSDRITNSLSNAGFRKPSLIQAACVPSIVSGKDVVVAAETGSGKTLCYLVPLMDKLCAASVDSEKATNDQELRTPHMVSLVLCPNVLLCEQVVRMATALRGDDGEPLLKVAAVCGGQGWPLDKPDILVSTPAALLNNMNPKIYNRMDFLRGVKHVVFDEADMLLCGSFQNQVIRLINMFRFEEKVLSRMSNSKVENPSTELDSCSLTNDYLEEEGLQNEYDSDEDEDEDGTSEGDPEVEDLKENHKTNDRSTRRTDWRRAREIYKRSKQYIFVAATLPINGKQTAGGLLKKIFPEASWVSGSYLHCHNPRLEQRWVEVSIETQVDALIREVKEGFWSESSDSGSATNRTMVFANTVEAAEAVATLLERSGIECYRYHKDRSLEERSNILSDFREKGGVFVCTDAASRGVDVPNVSHVIQADFATSAVDFLHRVGRTGRAGQRGLVTSMYTEANRDLVDAIRQAWRLGQPVETAFSRKRGFRNKLKKKRSFELVGKS
ncbi:hypothetical protein ACFE04_022342 [Oxalis oulophora]